MNLIFAMTLLINTDVGSCGVSSTDGSIEYGRFFDLSFRETGMRDNGLSTAESISLTKDEKTEAWSCLLKSSRKKYCGAVALLSGCYKHGFQQGALQCSKDIGKYKEYMALRMEVCPN